MALRGGTLAATTVTPPPPPGSRTTGTHHHHQVPPGGTSFQFRDPTEARHAVWRALTSKDNPKPLNESHYALAIGVQVREEQLLSYHTLGELPSPSASHLSPRCAKQGLRVTQR